MRHAGEKNTSIGKIRGAGAFLTYVTVLLAIQYPCGLFFFSLYP
jgi:hypothetical protein